MSKISCKLEDLIIYISRGITPKYTETNDNSCIVLNQKCIRDFSINFNPSRRNDTLLRKVSDEKFIKQYDVLINSTGVGTLGRVAQFLDNNPSSITVDSHITIVRPNANKIYPLFFGYLLKSKQTEIENLAQGTTGQTELSRDDLKNMIVEFTNNTELQIKHSEFLLNIDDKIQLNTQINQTLEAIAQAIFKSWFVDFDPVRAKAQAILDGKTSDEVNLSAMAVISGKAIEDLSQTEYQELWEIADAFPSELVENDLPKGWRIDKVGDIVNVVDYVANGSFASLKENVTLLDEPDYAIYVRTTDFNSRFSKDLKYVNKHSYDFLKKSSLNGNDIIISNVGDVGTVFRPPSWLNIPMTLGSNAIALKSENLSNYLYLYFKSSFGQWQIQGITSGSAQMKFNKTGFRGLEILIPNKKILSFFENQLNEIYNKITDNLKENKTLAQTRDELLPKLLSGEIEL